MKEGHLSLEMVNFMALQGNFACMFRRSELFREARLYICYSAVTIQKCNCHEGTIKGNDM